MHFQYLYILCFSKREVKLYSQIWTGGEKRKFSFISFSCLSLGGKIFFYFKKQKHKNEHNDLPNFKYNSYEITALEHLNLKWHQPMSEKWNNIKQHMRMLTLHVQTAYMFWTHWPMHNSKKSQLTSTGNIHVSSSTRLIKSLLTPFFNHQFLPFLSTV